MSDKLSEQLQSISHYVPTVEPDPDQRLIDALSKALDSTTPERAGCPWDNREDEHERQRSGIWLPEAE